MKLRYVLLLVLAVLSFAGCRQKSDETADDTQAPGRAAVATCPGCGEQMAEDTYCAGCNAVATTETALVHCSACDKDFKPGTYCAVCNRFMLNARVQCRNCQDLVIKGHYCPGEKLFKGLVGVVYCEQHKTPYAKEGACPSCAQKNVAL